MTHTPVRQDELTNALLLRLIEQAHGHAFLLLSVDGVIIWSNLAAEHLFAAKRADLIGRPFHEIFTDSDKASGIDGLEMAIAGSNAISGDDRWHVRADGSQFWSSGALLPIKDTTGKLLAFGKIIRDRTDFKTQVELLTNQRDRVAKADAEKDKAITQLSHEVRNVIAGVRGAVDLLDTPFDNADRRLKFSQLMRKQLAIVERLTQDLLDVKRTGGGKVSLQFEPLVIQAELRDLVASVEQRLQEQRLTLQLLAPPADVIVRADRTRLQQIFGNVLSNAIKYTQPGGRIWVKVTAEDNQAVVHIEDNGRGIPHEMLTDIFELFTQVDTATSAGGLGVGLALVRELVLLHGGSVQAMSQGLGKGSEFSVRLPLAALETQSN